MTPDASGTIKLRRDRRHWVVREYACPIAAAGIGYDVFTRRWHHVGVNDRLTWSAVVEASGCPRSDNAGIWERFLKTAPETTIDIWWARRMVPDTSGMVIPLAEITNQWARDAGVSPVTTGVRLSFGAAVHRRPQWGVGRSIYIGVTRMIRGWSMVVPPEGQKEQEKHHDAE